jgi:hypothetical protein
MKTSAQRVHQPQEAASSSIARSQIETPRSGCRERPLLDWQPTFGLRAAPPTRRAQAEEPCAGIIPAVSSRFGHNFSRIRIHSSCPRELQAKLAINRPGEEFEQEADRVAETVMRMPAPQLQRKCACGGTPGPTGECEACRQKRFSLQRVRQSSGAFTSDASFAPHIVYDVLSSPGQPLDAATRSFMEPRFGYDFSHVRVHSNEAAEQSAHDVNALAFTVGRHIVFGRGRFAPDTSTGRKLIAHELTHVVQQDSASVSQPGATPVSTPNRRQLMRSIALDSTIGICHRVLTSRNIDVSKGGLRVVLLLRPLDKNVPNCGDHDFSIALTRPRTLLPDKELASCDGRTGGTRIFAFSNVPSDTYYLTIAREFDNPDCCMDGDILAFDEPISEASPSCRQHQSLSTMDIVHGALDIAGFIPVLGAIPDGLNAGIYAVEGDWVNAGFSLVAMVPLWGDGVKLAQIGGKASIRISEKAGLRLGEEGIAKVLKEGRAAGQAEKAVAHATEDTAKALSKVEQKATGGAADEALKESEKVEQEASKKAAEKAAKEAADKALQKRIEECLAIWAAYKALPSCKKCSAADTAAERAAKIACITATLAGRQAYLNKDCDDILPGSISRGSAVAKQGHETQAAQLVKMLANCSTLPTR